MIESSIDFICILPELSMLILVNAYLLFALCFSNYHLKIANSMGDLRIGYQITPRQISLPLSGLVVLSLIFSIYLIINCPIENSIILNTSFICDPVVWCAKVLLIISSAAALLLCHDTIQRFSSYEFVILLYLAILSMLCLISSHNFLSFYLCIELQSLCFYMLAGMRSRSEFSTEASLKYFILGAFSSAILLLGISLIYGITVSIYYADVSAFFFHFDYEKDGESLMVCLFIALTCITTSLLFKLGAAPFHTWVADVYEGSPIYITAFFAICAKIAVLTLLTRLTFLFQSDMLMIYLAIASGFSLLIGSLSAMRQTKIKRLLALSGVANVGWFLLALACGQWQVTFIHLMVYIFLSITLFSIFVTPLFRSHPNLGYLLHSEKSHGITDHGADNNTIKIGRAHV